jgi:hypothetical protein
MVSLKLGDLALEAREAEAKAAKKAQGKQQ